VEVIAPGQMVRYLPGFATVRNPKYEGICTVLRVEEPGGDIQERMALVLNPTGETSWEFFCNLTPVTP